MELNRAWSPQRLADAVGRHRRTVSRWCERGLVPSERVAGRRGGESGSVYVIPEATAEAIVRGDYVFPVAA